MAAAIERLMDRNVPVLQDRAHPISDVADALQETRSDENNIQGHPPTCRPTKPHMSRDNEAYHGIGAGSLGSPGKVRGGKEEHVILSSPENSAPNRFSGLFFPNMIAKGESPKSHRRADSENVLSASKTITSNDGLTLRKSHSAVDGQRRGREEHKYLSPPFDESRLEHQLVVALKIESSTHREFLPRGALENLVTQRAVDQELSRVDYLPKRFKHRPWWPATNVWIGSVEDHESVRRIQLGLSLVTGPQPARLCYQQILAILLLMGRPKKIWYFVKERVSDIDLPLVIVRQKGIYSFQRRDQAQVPVRCLKKQSHISDFATRQWCVLAPFFGEPDKETISHHVIQKGRILPIVHWENVCRQGGSGQVYKAEVHPDHHAFDRHEVQNNVVAVKRLSILDFDVFGCELYVLQNLRKREHLRQHLTTLLASYEQDDHLYLILPWAECDLEQYWKSKFPLAPANNTMISSWLKQQCCGMAEAVSQIHRYQTSSGTTMLEMNRFGPQTREGSQSKQASSRKRTLNLFGRHGDIKPANILWFPDRSSEATHGTLKISDFGTARFSGKQKAVVQDRTTVPNSIAYQSPECVLPDNTISSQCDVWSLGCVFLEFVCWYFGGRELLLKFERDRTHLCETSSFFSTTTHERTRSMSAELKIPVREMIERLKKDSASNIDLLDILDTVQKNMLVILKESAGVRNSVSEDEGFGKGERKSLANIARFLGREPL